MRSSFFQLHYFILDKTIVTSNSATSLACVIPAVDVKTFWKVLLA